MPAQSPDVFFRAVGLPPANITTLSEIAALFGNANVFHRGLRGARCVCYGGMNMRVALKRIVRVLVQLKRSIGKPRSLVLL